MLDIRDRIGEFSRSSLKSPSITQGVLDTDTCLSSLVSTVVNAVQDTLGDRYTRAI